MTLENESHSPLAFWWFIFIMALIVFSVGCFVMESVPGLTGLDSGDEDAKAAHPTHRTAGGSMSLPR